MTSAPEQRERASSPVYCDLEEYIDDMKLVATPHDRGALEDAKKKLLDKHYKSQHIQKWKGDDFEYKWEKLGIKPGIGRELADNVGAFARRKKPAHAVTHMPPPRSSTRPLSPMGLAATPTASIAPSSRGILDSIEEDGRYDQKEKESYFEDDEDLYEADDGAYDEDYEYT